MVSKKNTLDMHLAGLQRPWPVMVKVDKKWILQTSLI